MYDLEAQVLDKKVEEYGFLPTYLIALSYRGWSLYGTFRCE